MKRFNIIFLFSCLLVPVCSDDDNKLDPTPISVNKYETGIDLISYSVVERSNRKFSEETGFALGYDYDITGKYVHPDAIREQVIDVAKMKSNFEVFGYFNHGQILKCLGDIKDVKCNIFKRCFDGDSDTKDLYQYKNVFNGLFAVFASDTTF